MRGLRLDGGRIVGWLRPSLTLTATREFGPPVSQPVRPVPATTDGSGCPPPRQPTDGTAPPPPFGSSPHGEPTGQRTAPDRGRGRRPPRVRRGARRPGHRRPGQGEPVPRSAREAARRVPRTRNPHGRGGPVRHARGAARAGRRDRPGVRPAGPADRTGEPGVR